MTTEIKNEIQLYDYQIKHVDDIIRKLGESRVTIAQLPTGGGKTVEFAAIANRYINKTGKSVLILVHREELLQQAKRTIIDMYGLDVSLIVAGVKSVRKVNVYIGMVESVSTRVQYMDLLDLGLVIMDEAHIGNFNKMHQIFTEELIIGFTATPIAASKKSPMNKYYHTIATGPQIKELIEMKRLAQNITRCPDDIVDERTLILDVKSGDFETRKMALEFSRPRYVANTVLFYLKWCRDEKTMIFNVNVEHSLEVTNAFNLMGIGCKHIDGNTPMEERRAALKWFKETRGAVLCNVGIAGVGFDEPTIKNIILNFATLSMPKFLQCCGRGSRYIKGQKEFFNIIDLGGNAPRFGDWNEDRDWEYIFDHPERVGKGGVPPVKTCPQCKGLVHAAVIVCKLPMADGQPCLWVFDRKKFEHEQLMTELVVITKGIDVKEITRKAVNKRAYYVLFEMGRIYASKVAESKITLTEHDVSTIFEDYFLKVIDWHKETFPNKKFNEEWHRHLARDHFYKTLQTLRNNSVDMLESEVF